MGTKMVTTQDGAHQMRNVTTPTANSPLTTNRPTSAGFPPGRTASARRQARAPAARMSTTALTDTVPGVRPTRSVTTATHGPRGNGVRAAARHDDDDETS